MNFKNIRKVIAASALLMLGLSACTTDTLTTKSGSSSSSKGEARQVRFSINTGSKSTTRATATTGTDVTALERENTVNTLYAVVFKPDVNNMLKPGVFSKTYTVTLSGAGTDNKTYSSATFTMDDDGLYYMYLVANPGAELEKNLKNDTGATGPLVSGTSTVTNFYALLETDRNPNDNSSTDFLMTSNVVQVDVQGDAETDLTNGDTRYIDMTRAVARIDIDATAIDDFELISVQFINRHATSVLVNTGTDATVIGTSSTVATDPTYTKPAVDGTYSFTDKWLAGIYAYENHKEASAGDETGVTQLVINGKLQGIAVSQTVDFYSKEETTPGSGTYTYTNIPLNRNTLYYVKLKPKATPDEYAPFEATISVADWRAGEKIVLAGENLAKACKPELVSIKRQLWDETNNVWADATELTLSTVSLDVVDNGSARTVTDGKKTYIGFNTCRLAIKVKAGTTGCNITCPEMDEVLTGASSSYHTGVTAADKKGLFEGEQSNPDKEYDVNGDMYLTWYVQIPDVNSGFQDFNFTLTNQLNSENDYITHFKVIFKDIKLNPLWYIAKYNLNSDLTFNTTEDYSQGYLFNWSTIMGKGYTYSTSTYDGYALPSTPKTVSNGESGATWHLGTAMEWRSIIPVTSGMGTSSGILFTSRIASHIIYSETACTFGYDNTTKYSNGTDNTSNAGVSYTSYWSNITGGTRYAIRFIGTYYVSAWRYQIISDGTKSRMVISSRLIDPIEESELSTMLSTIQSTDESFWSEDEDQGVIQRVFYYTGHSTSEGNAPGANKTFNSNGTYYWNTSYNYNGIGFYYNDIYWENLTNCRVCARLFRDSQ